VVAELARRVAGHVGRQLRRRPRLKLQGERPVLLRIACRCRHQRQTNRSTATLHQMRCVAVVSIVLLTKGGQGASDAVESSGYAVVLTLCAGGFQDGQRANLQADGADAALVRRDHVR
jgi:hypothetical protein